MHAASQQSPTCRIVLQGDLDAHVGSDVRAMLRSAMDAGHRAIEVDLSAVTFIDSTALGVLFGAHCRLQARKGTMVIVGARPSIAHVFRATGLGRAFGIEDEDHHGSVGDTSHAVPLTSSMSH